MRLTCPWCLTDEFIPREERFGGKHTCSRCQKVSVVEYEESLEGDTQHWLVRE